uniref:NADH-ubiquinone oxidoreductase chain 1 n=1 Tax=Calophya californica TaxID=2047826 RepID=A0A343LDP7_9HEMI|nr:NADH dehydrogenase subunit 1 [Calophya californica]ATN42472.1 NADH dehydrogenase subunit 1 [Calophya californica]
MEIFFLNFFNCLIMSLFSLVGVAFLVLMERKMLGYLQFRKGPNKVGVWGVFQPFSDAVKLYTKEFFFPCKSNFFIYWFSPFLSMFISLIIWFMFPYTLIVVSWKFSILFMFMVMSFSVYGVMLSGWSSNSSYSLLGCMRVLAQSISYEVSFFILILSTIFFTKSLSIYSFCKFQNLNYFFFLMIPLFIMIFTSFLAELNRTPFDFSEGESELVSGFNVEYGGAGFAFIFLAEYLSIIFSSSILCWCFLGSLTMNFIFFFKVSFLTLIIILIRGVLPRYRYDKLMNLCWKIYLCSSLFLLLFYSSISI